MVSTAGRGDGPSRPGWRPHENSGPKLEKSKALVEMIVIDHLEKTPAGNESRMPFASQRELASRLLPCAMDSGRVAPQAETGSGSGRLRSTGAGPRDRNRK